VNYDYDYKRECKKGETFLKKKILSIMLATLMVSLTACGSNSNNTSQNTSQNEPTQEVSENSVEEEKTVDSKEEKESEAESKEDKTAKKKESKESESSVNEETTSENDVKTTSNEKKADTNKESDKPEATAEPTKEPVENTPAPVQSQTFNVNITATGFVVTDNGPVNEVVDFGNFIITINGDAHVVSELSGWALKDYSDGSYDVNILVPLAAQDANNSYSFEIKCPDSIKNATITNVNDGYYPFSFTVNNGTISGTATAVTEQVVVEGSSIWVFFNVKLN
jgi:DNA mismatch repair ATPase MutL